jgi:hypothetical protein
MLFTCYCAFIIIITIRGNEKKLFVAQDINVTLVVCLQISLYNLSC